jgi:hypothetical protein
LCPPTKRGKEVVLQQFHSIFKGCDLCSVDGDRRFCVCYRSKKDLSRENRCKKSQKANSSSNMPISSNENQPEPCNCPVAWTLGVLNVLQLVAMGAAAAFVMKKRLEEEMRQKKEKASEFQMKKLSDFYEVPISGQDNSEGGIMYDEIKAHNVPDELAPRMSDYVNMSLYR